MRIFELIKNLILSEGFFTIIGIICTTFLTYYFARKTTRRAKSQEIYNIQLNKIYLPLHNLVFNKKVDDINSTLLLKTLTEKTYRYNLYCSSKFIKLTNQLSKEINMNRINKKTLKFIQLYIENEFNILKYRLGYPFNTRDFFRNKYAIFTIINYVWCFTQVFLVSLFYIYIIFGPEYYGSVFLKVFEIILLLLFCYDFSFSLITITLFIYNYLKWKL